MTKISKSFRLINISQCLGFERTIGMLDFAFSMFVRSLLGLQCAIFDVYSCGFNMRLLLHVGHGKTGSSWLQSWFANNACNLETRLGLRYLTIDPLSGDSENSSIQGKFSMGNGFMLEPWLKRERNVSTIRDLVKGLPVTGGLIFSCENWMKPLPKENSALNELCEVLEVKSPEIWLLVRDPLDHACSLYNQKVKAQGFRGSLGSWMKEYDIPYFLYSFLQVYAKAYVTHYGRSKAELEKEALIWMNDEYIGNWNSPPSAKINRSLTARELKFMRFLNLLAGRASRPFGQWLTQIRPFKASAQLEPTEEEVASFARKWRHLIGEINYKLPLDAKLKH